ncbi:MAG TPA: hypothetical protein PK546_02940 [Chitinophagales bacterium]|jgi:hypothetical protein|nr:hypothetical protein [Chitinophagales bacterium]
MSRSLSRYLKIAFLNLLVVAFLGVLMRYKILYSLPFIDQKNLLHGHSHFAFSGWITQTLMVLLVAYLSKATGKDEFISYKKLLLANLITAYGMLIAFPIQGYGMVSIFFSTLSVFISYIFAFFFWKDLNKIENQNVAHYWFKAGLLLNVFSSIGTFGLAFMMANKIADQTWYLAAVYFYLHFQYNGWFFFTCMGLFYFILPTKIIATNKLKRIFWLFALASIPAYFLSTLWMSLPLWVYILVVLASFVQVIAWIVFVRVLFTSRNIIITTISKEVKWLFGLSAVALTIKLLLQLSSTIPYLSQLAFGFRSIVIAYLHLVLLGVITIFLLGYIFTLNVLTVKKTTVYGVIIFVIGIFLNELMLMLQGVASFSYTIIPYTNELLLSFALMMFSGIILLLVSQLRK